MAEQPQKKLKGSLILNVFRRKLTFDGESLLAAKDLLTNDSLQALPAKKLDEVSQTTLNDNELLPAAKEKEDSVSDSECQSVPTATLPEPAADEKKHTLSLSDSEC